MKEKMSDILLLILKAVKENGLATVLVITVTIFIIVLSIWGLPKLYQTQIALIELTADFSSAAFTSVNRMESFQESLDELNKNIIKMNILLTSQNEKISGVSTGLAGLLSAVNEHKRIMERYQWQRQANRGYGISRDEYPDFNIRKEKEDLSNDGK